METANKFTTIWTQYEVTLDRSDTSLRIDIQDIYSGATFTKEILGDHTKSVTKICNTSPELFETLKIALTANNPDLALQLDEQKNKLTYTCSQKIPFPTTFTFDITLDRRTVSETDKIIPIVKRLSQTHGLTISPVFSDLKHSNCKLSANLKEITKTANENSWFGYIGQPKLPATGKSRFSVKILKTVSGNRHIMIGVTVSGTANTAGFFAQAKSWMFYTHNGHIYTGGGVASYFTRFPVSQGDVISVLMDMDTLMLSFELNSVSLGPAARLTLQENEKQNLCPAVDLYNVNDSVAFL